MVILGISGFEGSIPFKKAHWPNLEDRVALTVLHEGWFPRRLAALAGAERAA